MQDDLSAVTERVNEPAPKPRRSFVRRVLLGLLVAALMAAAAIGGYWWRDRLAIDETKVHTDEIARLWQENIALKQKAENQQSTGDTAQTEVTCTVKRPSASVVESVKAAITSGNTAALEGYMAPSVNVIYAASDGLGQRTAANAVSDVTSFISKPNATWSFDVPASVLSSYGQGSYKQYFPGTALVAQATDTRLLSISFDCDGKIATLLLVANESSLQ